MNCYVCKLQGKDEPAVAICIVCGMGLCLDHVVREELPVYESVNAGMAASRHKLPATLPRILCSECYQALHQTG
jgi:hypothetical protein